MVRQLQRWWLIPAAVILVPSGYVFYVIETGNFGVISNGLVYRSAQLDAEQLAFYIKKYAIKSILNLRGRHDSSEWYRNEIQIAQSYGVEHYDYPIAVQREADEEDIERIVEIIQKASKPILIHCKSGVDRTGLVAALYLYKIEQKSAEEASTQLSILHGHFPYLGSESKAMDSTFWRYVRSQGRRRTASWGMRSPAEFYAEWIGTNDKLPVPN